MERGKPMKDTRTYKKLKVLNLSRILFLYLAAVDFVGSVIQIREKDMHQGSWSLVITFACLAGYYIMDIKKGRILWGYCNFEEQRERIRRLFAKKKYRGYARLHLDLLFSCLVLGRYEESLHEIEELRWMEGRIGGLKDKQRLQFRLWNLDYMISVNEIGFLEKELEEAQEILEKIGGLSSKKRQRIEEEIRLRRYMAEERWEDILGVLKEFPGDERNVPVYMQIYMAYIRGKCCYQLGRYGEALRELRFAARWGGDTKYVAFANDLMEKIEEKGPNENRDAGEVQIIKYRAGAKGIFLAASCFMALLSCVSVSYCSRGGSVEEAYGRRYLCDGSELTVVYSENIGDYELAVLDGEEEAGYCLFRETSGSGCRIVESFRTEKETESGALKETERFGGVLSGAMREYFLNVCAETEIRDVMAGFYLKNDMLHRQDMRYAGITCYPRVKNMTINGKKVNVEEIGNADGEPVYLWSVEGIDLEEDVLTVVRMKG